MIKSTSLSWILVLVLAGTAGWFLFRGLRSGHDGTPPAVADRISQLAHALMAAAMMAMVWPMG
jgi:hypothetical protein